MTERTPPPITSSTPIGPDVDLDRDDVRLADGTRLTEQKAADIVDAGPAPRRPTVPDRPGRRLAAHRLPRHPRRPGQRRPDRRP